MKDITSAILQICGRVAEAQAQLVESAQGTGKSAPELREYLLALFGEPELLDAMRAVECFPAETLGPETTPMLREPAPASQISDEIRAELAAICDKIEAYGFHTETGSLKRCAEWMEMRHLLGVFRH